MNHKRLLGKERENQRFVEFEKIPVSPLIQQFPDLMIINITCKHC